MPSPYARDTARLKVEIVARVAGGEVLRDICAPPGMPKAQTVRMWARTDAAFGDEMAAAARRGEWSRVFGYDEAVAGAFLAAARAGAGVKALLGRPGMPSRRTYEHWKATQAPFCEAVFMLRRRRNEKLGEIGRARRRAFDPVVADRVIVALNRGIREGLRLEAVLAADPELPCRPTLRRWRREQPAFDRVLRMMFAARRTLGMRLRGVPELLVEEIVDHIVEGGSFASFGRLPGGPSRGTLRRWFHADPAFAEQVGEACEWREAWYGEQILDTATRTPPGPVREMERGVGGLKRHLVRLRHRPGAVHVRRAAGLSPERSERGRG